MRFHLRIFFSGFGIFVFLNQDICMLTIHLDNFLGNSDDALSLCVFLCIQGVYTLSWIQREVTLFVCLRKSRQ